MVGRPAVIGVLCLSILVAQAAQAQPRSTPLQPNERQVASCIDRAAKGRPWLAKTLWGLRDQEGGWIGAAIRNSNGSEDLGPLQVNSRWALRISAIIGRRPAEVRRWLRYDACFNIEAARWIFLSALAVTRDYWKAVGMYHSPIGRRQVAYAKAVRDRIDAHFGKSIR